MLVTWMVALHSLVTLSYSIYEIVLLVIYINVSNRHDSETPKSKTEGR